jgi:CheY-like chemotaxis protein
MNLASNARDAMPQGGMLSFEVVRDTREGTDGVLVCVSDTGAGMSSSVLDRAFDPFFSTKARGQGTGLGLSIVHGIVEQHGGRITVQSRVGQGTVFRLFFPLTDKRPEPSQRPPLGDGRNLQGEARILVVDDDQAVLQLVVEVLERFGYDVESAASLRALTELLAHPELRPVDLLLSDVILPDGDGNQIKRVVQQRFPGIGCVFMTGHADEVLAPRGILRDRVELLRKPFAADELLQKVRSLLQHARLRASSSPRLTQRESSPPSNR